MSSGLGDTQAQNSWALVSSFEIPVEVSSNTFLGLIADFEFFP